MNQNQRPNPSRFEAGLYSEYRPLYPAETFAGLETSLLKRGFSAPFQLADIGCGTGFASSSLLNTGISMNCVGIDPDEKMIEKAEKQFSEVRALTWKIGSGEKTDLETQSCDAIIIGSAFHWMHPQSCIAEFSRILRPKGVIRVFEYQFPKSLRFPELNEWIRREFNLRWKAPLQKPRGSLKELAHDFFQDPRFEFLGEGKPPMRNELSTRELHGLLLSQSRVLHYQDALSEEERMVFHRETLEKLESFLGNTYEEFDFKLSWLQFGLI